MKVLQALSVLVTLLVPLHAENILTVRSLEKSRDGCTPLLTVCFDGQTMTSNSTYCELEIRNNSSSLTAGLVSPIGGHCQTFEVDISSYTGKTIFILTLFEANHGKAHKVQAYGNATVTLRNITFHSNWIGSKSVGYYGRSIRIQHDYVATKKERLEANLVGSKNGQSSSCTTSPCFLMEIKNARQSNQVQFCVWNMAPSDTNGVKVCETKLPGNFVGQTIPELPKPNPIELKFHENNWKPYIFITGAFDDSTEYLEIVLFKIGGGIHHVMTAKCQHILGGPTKSCKVKANSLLHGQYQVLLTALDAYGRVTHSSTSQLENYGTKLKQMTTDLVEVQWRVFENGIYEISLDTEVPGSYNTLRVPCGVTNSPSCTAYFIKLVPNTYYSVSVVMLGNGMKSIVTRSIAITADMEEHLKVYSLATNATDQQRYIENLTVCVEDTIDSNKFDLVLIDQWGSIVRTSDMLQGKDVLCFPSVTLHQNFDISGRIRILVMAEVMYNFFYGDTELYILDLNHLKHKPLLRAHQVSRRSVRVKWLNLNDGEVVVNHLITLPNGKSMPSTSTIKCKYMEECGTYLYFNSRDASFQIMEVGETIQTVNVKMTLTNIPAIEMIKSSIVLEGQAEVCFNKVSNAFRYEMGLQVESKLLEDVRKPLVIPHGPKRVCLISRNNMEVGPAAIIGIVISSFDSRGSLIAGASDILPANFISSSKSVVAVSALDGIMASWEHLEEVNDNNDYRVTLEALDDSNVKEIEAVEASDEAFLHMFLWNGVGEVAVCLLASREISNVFNGRTCSNVIHIDRLRALRIPMVRDVNLRNKSPESILVTWEAPNDSEISNYVILWNLDITHDIDHHVREEDAVYILSPVVGGQRFSVVSASKTSYLLNGLDENNKYLVCVSAVVSNIMGRKHCLVIRLDSSKSLSYPLDIEYNDGSLQWSGNNSTHCMVEWELQEGDGGRAEVQGNSLDLNLSPGVWEIKVSNITKNAASGPTKIQTSVSGISVSSSQTNQTSLRLTWSESNGIPNMMGFGDNYAYNITLLRNGSPLGNPLTSSCSGRKYDCYVDFGGIYASPKDKLSVEVYSHRTEARGGIHLQMYKIQNVTSLNMKMSNFKKAKVTWTKVADAKQYRYILFDRQRLQMIRLVGTQPENVLLLNMPDLAGCVVSVQVCIAENACGDFRSITLEFNSGHSVAVIFGMSVLVTAVFLVVIFFAFRQKKVAKPPQADRQKILDEEATSSP